MRYAALLSLATAAAYAQGTTPKPKAADYPLHAAAGGVEIGADYMIHSFGGAQMFIARDYLVVEVALYPKKGETVEVNAGRFMLRLNGKKQLLLPQAPGMVAASLKYDDWMQRPRFDASAGAGGVDVGTGRTGTTERFPGDPRPGQQRLPRPPQAPGAEDRSGAEPPPPVKPDEVAVETALREGPSTGPVSGFLYFAYRGNAGKLKSVELVYQDAVLKLK
jgi:hypothetical protein